MPLGLGAEKAHPIPRGGVRRKGMGGQGVGGARRWESGVGMGGLACAPHHTPGWTTPAPPWRNLGEVQEGQVEREARAGRINVTSCCFAVQV